MKTFRLAFLLGILSTSLIGCGNGGGGSTTKVKVTFNGTNCFIRNGLDDKAPEFTTLEVEKNSSQTFQIFVKETDKYLVPEGSKVDTGDVKHEYYQSTDTAGHKEGQLVFPKIEHDVTITATARTKGETTYLVHYPYDAYAEWSGPKLVKSGDGLEANVKLTDGYVINKLTIYIGNDLKPCTNFTFENNKLIIPYEAINGDVYIFGNAHLPDATYSVVFNVDHAIKGKDFPTEMKEGAYLEATFTAEEGYRLPIQDGTPKCEEFSVHAKGSGQDVALQPFSFATGGDYVYYTSGDGKTATIAIFEGAVRGHQIDSVEFEGMAVEQVQVTFKVGKNDTEGHWTNAEEGHEHDPRIGIIDKGKELGDAATIAGANVTPVKEDEDPAYHFDGWFDENDNEIGSGEEVNDNLVVHAQYAIKSCAVINEISKEITVSPELPKSVNYNASLAEVTFTAKTGYRLPEKEKVSVTMRHIDEQGDHWEPIGFNNFNYEREDGNTTATFSIGENIITGDIKIAITPILYYSITFDPDGGTWPTGGTAIKTTTVPADYTYAEAFDTLKTRGYPTKSGQKLSAWKWNETTSIDMKEKIKADNMVLKAEYSEIATFQNDSWANVIKHAEAGDLKETYLDTIFLGAERTLTYVEPMTSEEKNYRVRVIDSGYDRYYTKDGEMVKSGLTFEFVDLVGEGRYGENLPDSQNGRNSWWDSTYRSSLSKFYNIICKLNGDFKAKPAIKHTLHGYVTPEEKDIIDPREMFETTEYLFPLSGAEMGIADSNGAMNATKYPEQQRENEAVVEGITVWPYEYYRGDTHSRVKHLFGEEPSSGIEYWLRSPKVYLEDDPSAILTSNCYFIEEKGGTSTDYAGKSRTADEPRGYMAAFCI